jgi:hypothetical protein
MRSAAVSNATAMAPTAHPVESSIAVIPESLHENVLLRGNTLYEPAVQMSHDWSPNHISPEHPIQALPAQEVLPYEKEPAPEESLQYLNNERRAFAVREFKAYKEGHSKSTPKPSKPAFLDITVPDLKQIQAALGYVFRSLPESRTDSARAANKERTQEIIKWTESFRQFIRSADKNEGQVDLLVALNATVESADWRMRRLFYQASAQANLMELLEELQESSKSVRVMKEVEEFQDAKEDWEEDMT